MQPEFAAGARNAVRTCLNIGPQDRVCIIRDRPRQHIAEAIEEEARATGATVRTWTMEDHLSRPATSFPRSIADDIIRFAPTASYFIGTGQKGELAFRMPMRELLTQQLHCRHGHMIGIDDLLMQDGMAADYEEIYRVTRQIYEIVRQARTISVTTSLGTEVVATFSPTLRWIFTCPQSVDGLIAAEEMGDWFTEKYGLLSPPARLVVKGGRLVSVETPDDQLSADIREYMAQHPNSNRAGEFAIGTNVGLSRIVGNFLQDEKFPGVHIAFGNPYGFETGADWDCPSHVDVLASHATVSVDGRTIMENGRFLV